MPAAKPKETKKHAEHRKTPEQLNLENKPANRDVELETKESVRLTFRSAHFFLAISAGALDKIQDLDDAPKRRVKLAKRVKARPEDETIPEGAKETETELIVAKAEHADLGGLT